MFDYVDLGGLEADLLCSIIIRNQGHQAVHDYALNHSLLPCEPKYTTSISTRKYTYTYTYCVRGCMRALAEEHFSNCQSSLVSFGLPTDNTSS
jgi:hypothetical protein